MFLCQSRSVSVTPVLTAPSCVFGFMNLWTIKIWGFSNTSLFCFLSFVLYLCILTVFYFVHFLNFDFLYCVTNVSVLVFDLRNEVCLCVCVSMTMTHPLRRCIFAHYLHLLPVWLRVPLTLTTPSLESSLLYLLIHWHEVGTSRQIPVSVQLQRRLGGHVPL